MIEVEQYLISSLFINPTAIIESDLAPDDFQDEFCRYVFTRMNALWSEKQDFSIADFMKVLQPENFETLKEISGLSITGSISQVRDYSLIVRESSERKRILSAVSSIRPDTPLVEMREIINKLRRIDGEQSKSKNGLVVLNEIKHSLEMPPSCDKTGLHDLDMAMGGGLYSSFVYGFCGAEKSGKTTLAHTISYNLDKFGTKHGYFALEMGAMYIEQRNIARDLGLNCLSFLNKRDEIKERLRAIKPRENIHYVDAPGFTIDEIISEASRMVFRHGIKGFIVDYWQLVSGADSRQTEEKHLRDVAQKLADFAKKQKIWVIILAQMNADGKLFGGGGLKKACEQLYMIRHVDGAEYMRWLEMDASRYTLRVNVGSDAVPSLVMDASVGPHFREV